LISFFFQAEDGIRDFHVTGVQTCALPISAYLHATEKVRLGTSHTVKRGRIELGVRAEDLGVRLEADPRTAAVVDVTQLLDRTKGLASGKALAEKTAAACHLDFEKF